MSGGRGQRNFFNVPFIFSESQTPYITFKPFRKGVGASALHVRDCEVLAGATPAA